MLLYRDGCDSHPYIVTNPCCRISGRLRMQKESHKDTDLFQNNLPFHTYKNICLILCIFRAAALRIEYLLSICCTICVVVINYCFAKCFGHNSLPSSGSSQVSPANTAHLVNLCGRDVFDTSVSQYN